MAETTLDRNVRRAAAGLLAATLVVGGGNLWATYDQVGNVRAADARAARATATVTELCQSGNQARAETVGLWDYIIRLSPPPKTAQQRAVLAEFERHLRAVFAPHDCAALLRPGR